MAYRQQKLHLAVKDIGVRKGRETQQTVYDDRDVAITSIRFFQTDLVASFHHCLRVAKPAADDDGVLKNVMDEDFDIACVLRRATFFIPVFSTPEFSTPAFSAPAFSTPAFSAPPL